MISWLWGIPNHSWNMGSSKGKTCGGGGGGGFNYKAKITYNEIWKLKDATEPYNETTS